MKWVAAALLIVSLLVLAAEDKCSVQQFYGIAYTIHNPLERHQQMSAWLTNHESFCSSKDMVVIWNNLPEWAGTADSVEIRSKVVRAYNMAIEREKK